MRTRIASASGRGSLLRPTRSPARRPSPSLVQPEVVDLARIVEAIEIDVKQRQPAAAIFLDQRERRAADVVADDAEAFGEAADERRLPGAEIAGQQHDRLGVERAAELASDRGGFGFGMCGEVWSRRSG